MQHAAVLPGQRRCESRFGLDLLPEPRNLKKYGLGVYDQLASLVTFLAHHQLARASPFLVIGFVLLKKLAGEVVILLFGLGRAMGHDYAHWRLPT